MAKILFRFWVRRLLFTFCVAFAGLFGLQFYREGFALDTLLNTWMIALAAGAISASLSTFLAYTRMNKALNQSGDK